MQNNELTVQYIESNKMPADVLTKGLSLNKHYNCIKDMNMDTNSNLRENVENNDNVKICCCYI